jgi:hypothetical protein
MRGTFLRALLMSFALQGALRAQPADPLRPGATVRVWAARPALSKQVGTIVAHQGDTLRIERRVTAPSDHRPDQPVWDTVHVAWSSVQQLDVRLVSHGRGALKGFLWGLGTGFLAGVGLARARDQENAVLAIPAMSVVGVVVGTFFGTAVGSERWRRVYP